MKLRAFLSTLLAALSLPALAAAQEGDDIMEVAYRGELVDDQMTPITGVFPLTFKLYEAAEGGEPIWTEQQFVAAREGTYDVHLGTQEPLAASFDGRSLHVGVELGDLGEIARHEITLSPAAEEEPEEELDVSHLTFADIADRALSADEAAFAENCQTLGGRTLEEIDRYEDLLSRISELRTAVNQRSSSLGNETTTLDRIGGEGGNPYTRTCPPGHVVTGARGGHGNLVDSVTLICSPLQ